MSENKELKDEELEKVSGGANCIKRNNLESKINQVVNFRLESNGIDCNVRIIKVDAHINDYYENWKVSVYATDELSYNILDTKRFDTDIIRLWGCDGVSPQDSGLGYGKNGFRLVFEDGDDAFFYDI